MPLPTRFWRWFFHLEAPAWQRRPNDPDVRRRIDDLASRLAASAGDRTGPIVDLACGTGDVAVAIRAIGRPAVGIDAAPGMVERARRAGLPVARSDLSRPFPLRTGAASGAVASYVVQFLPDPAAFLREAHRVLEPGAPLLLGLPGKGWTPPPFRDARSRVYWLGRQIVSYVPGAIRRWTEDEAVALVRAGGFDVREVTRRGNGLTILAYSM